jgi:hypothetical protein
MAHGCFTDRDDSPGLERAAAAVADAGPPWTALLEGLRPLPTGRPVRRFYVRSHGWAPVPETGGRALTVRFPDEGRFTALVVLTGRQMDAAPTDSALSRETRARIASRPRISEGRWVFRRVTNETDAFQARRLVAIQAVRTQRG